MNNESLSSQIIVEAYDATTQSYITVGSLALLTYVSLLHFADEREYIWGEKFSLPTYLYFLSKYPVFLYFSLGITINSLPNETLSVCNDLNTLSGVMGLLGFVGVQGLISVRVYSICQGYLPVTIALSICFIAALAAQIYESVIPCSASQVPSVILLINSITVIISDILAFLVTIRQVWGVWKLKRSLQRGNEFHVEDLVTLLLQQSILRFGFVLVFTTTALFLQIFSLIDAVFVGPLQNVLSTLLMCEFTIALRRRNKNGSASNQSALDLPTISFEGGPVHSVRSVLGRLSENIIAEMGERNDSLNHDADPVSEEADALQLQEGPRMSFNPTD